MSDSKSPTPLTRDEVSETIHLLSQYRGYRSDQQLADAMGKSRSFVQSYTGARSSPNVEQLAAFAEALNVEPFVLLLSKNEALRWVIENRPERLPADMKERRRKALKTTAKASPTRRSRGVVTEGYVSQIGDLAAYRLHKRIATERDVMVMQEEGKAAA